MRFRGANAKPRDFLSAGCCAFCMAEKAEPSKASPLLIQIDGGKLTAPAPLLVEEVADAVGGWVRGWQIRRVGAAGADVKRLNGEAEADPKLALARGDSQVDSVERRAPQRL